MAETFHRLSDRVRETLGGEEQLIKQRDEYLARNAADTGRAAAKCGSAIWAFRF